MKYSTSTTHFNCGIDLHARQMYVCLMDRAGKKLVHTNIKNNDFDYFLKLVAPYRHDLTVCAECMFGWYWLADACQAAGLPFVLAHALYLNAIHGGKNKNDRIDSGKIAHLLRSNLIPPVPGGGLSPDGRRWVPARREFLLHHRALGDRFRTVFQQRLQQEAPALFAQVPAPVWKAHWNVGCQAAGSGENALRYLARYVFKTATANRQLPLLPEGQVRWDYRASKTGRPAAIQLEPLELIRRFLQHVLPRNFARVRTFGWFTP